jgi:hypothetical protein
MLWAKGDLAAVRFMARLTVNGVEYPEMVTERQDLNENQSTFFISDLVNITTGQPLELNTSDVIGFSLSLDHEDTQYYRRFPPPGQGKNVTLVLGGTLGSFVQFPTNSMQVTEITGMDDPVGTNWLVSATIKCSFGTDDFKSASASTSYQYGNEFIELSKTFLDDATVEMEWEWVYDVSQGGSYPVTVSAKDQSSRIWSLTEDIHITTPDTAVDFAISEDDISFSNDPKIDENTTITAKILGSGMRWDSYQVKVEFYDGSDLIESVTAKLQLDKKREVSVLWVPESGGKHEITVKVDADDALDETNEKNNEATVTVDVKEDSDSNGTPGFEAVYVLVAISIVLIFGKIPRKNKFKK